MFDGYRVSVLKDQNSRYLLHNNVNMGNTTELYIEKMVKMRDNTARWHNRRPPAHIPSEQQYLDSHPWTKVGSSGTQAGDFEILVEPMAKEGLLRRQACLG